MSLKSELQKRVEQLEGRIVSINHYVSIGALSFIGNKQYTNEDILKVEKQIEETKAALCGINEWEKDERNFHLLTDE